METIKVEIVENTAIIKINRPEKMNALNTQVLEELSNVLSSINKDDDVFSVIITGEGEKAFVAGADIKELNNLNMIEALELSQNGQKVFNKIEEFNKPIIAAINGFALGGGCELALSCHIRIASENAKFGQPEINLGLIPGYGGTQRLSKLINKGRAAELILTGDIIDSHEAFRIGLVNKIVTLENLLSAAMDVCKKINSKSKIIQRLALQAINSSANLTLKEGLNLEASLFSICFGTEDFKEGTNAFIEKRKPEFRNK